MSSTVLTTPVDTLVKIVKENQPCTISFIKGQLRLPIQLIEKWLVILDEYKVISIKYKGLEGFVSLNQEKKKEDISVESIKETFIEKCASKKITFSQMTKIWPRFVQEFEGNLKESFWEENKKKGYSDKKINLAWLKFKKDLEKF